MKTLLEIALNSKRSFIINEQNESPSQAFPKQVLLKWKEAHAQTARSFYGPKTFYKSSVKSYNATVVQEKGLAYQVIIYRPGNNPLTVYIAKSKSNFKTTPNGLEMWIPAYIGDNLSSKINKI